MTLFSRMSGFGFALPPKIVSNAEIAAYSDITEEWIVSRTGIFARHTLEDGMTGTDLALSAAQSALDRCRLTPADITHILYATCTPDACCPSAACTLAGKLGVENRMAVDINAACAGFVNCLELADAIVARRPDSCVLLVASESLSHRCNWEDRSTAVLFGDGAGAVLITGANPCSSTKAVLGPSGAILDVLLGCDGEKGDMLLISGGFSAQPYKLGDTVGPEYFIRMNGGLVFKQAVRRMGACCADILERNQLSPDDIDLFIPHQANLRIIDAVGSRLGISMDRVFLNVQKYGNTSAASIPIALAEAVDAGRITSQARVLVTTFGGGLTWGAALLQF